MHLLLFVSKTPLPTEKDSQKFYFAVVYAIALVSSCFKSTNCDTCTTKVFYSNLKNIYYSYRLDLKQISKSSFIKFIITSYFIIIRTPVLHAKIMVVRELSAFSFTPLSHQILQAVSIHDRCDI